MRFARSIFSLTVLTTLFLTTALAFVGCGSEETITGVTPDGGIDLLVEDPLDGILNSTMGATPAEPGPRIDRLAEALGLTEEQKTALAAAYAEFRSAMETIKDQVKSGDLTRDEARATADEVRAAFEANLQVILTPEQYDMLQEMRQKRDGEGRGQRDCGDRWNAWLEEIGADGAQIEAVFAALAVLHEGMADLRDQVKDGSLTRPEVKDAAEALRDAFDAALQSILTAEQYAALQDLRPDQPGPHGGRPDPRTGSR